jgi:chromosome segregation ATPase
LSSVIFFISNIKFPLFYFNSSNSKVSVSNSNANESDPVVKLEKIIEPRSVDKISVASNRIQEYESRLAEMSAKISSLEQELNEERVELRAKRVQAEEDLNEINSLREREKQLTTKLELKIKMLNALTSALVFAINQ